MKTYQDRIDTRRGKRFFVRSISRAIADEVCRHIVDGKIPTAWDGHELRVMLAKLHEQSAATSILVRDPTGTRARNFNNHVIVNNL